MPPLDAPPSPNDLTPDLEKGADLFHSVGCVACHEPRRKPEAIEEDFGDDAEWEIEETTAETSPSIPLPDLRKKTWLEPLSAFLADPYHTRPGGRMPDMKLTEEESTSLAAYLTRMGRAVPRKTFSSTRVRPRLARQIFHEIGCINCHSSAGDKNESSLSGSGTHFIGGGEGMSRGFPSGKGFPIIG